MLITVHREVSPWDAHIVMGRLRAEGLHPSLHSEHHIRMVWRFSMVLGMVQIQVPLAEAACARAVLDDWRAGLYQEAMERELGLPAEARCPQCQQYDWQPLRDIWWRLLACAMLFFWHAMFPPEVIGRRCRVCGYVERSNQESYKKYSL
jgi:Zn ribbon nucleic-acid-binding protein